MIEDILEIMQVGHTEKVSFKSKKTRVKYAVSYTHLLPEEERRNQILLLIGFFIVLFIIGGIGEFIRHKFNKKKQYN